MHKLEYLWLDGCSPTQVRSKTKIVKYFQYRLKGISLLPRKNGGAYKQMPYEAIDEKTYHFEVEKLGKLSFVGVEGEEAEIDKFCNNDVCEIIPISGDE